MDSLLYSVTALVFFLGLFLLYRAYRARQAAKEHEVEIRWILWQLERALKQLNSENELEIIAGLQALSVLNDPAIGLRALPKLTALAQSNNPRIAESAQTAIHTLSSALNTTLKTSPVNLRSADNFKKVAT